MGALNKGASGWPVGEAPMNPKEFAGLDWKAQSAELHRLNVLSCQQEGKTYGEAERKRAPIDAHHRNLQAIHDAQVAAWVAEGDRQIELLFGEVNVMLTVSLFRLVADYASYGIEAKKAWLRDELPGGVDDPAAELKYISDGFVALQELHAKAQPHLQSHSHSIRPGTSSSGREPVTTLAFTLPRVHYDVLVSYMDFGLDKKGEWLAEQPVGSVDRKAERAQIVAASYAFQRFLKATATKSKGTEKAAVTAGAAVEPNATSPAAPAAQRSQQPSQWTVRDVQRVRPDLRELEARTLLTSVLSSGRPSRNDGDEALKNVADDIALPRYAVGLYWASERDAPDRIFVNLADGTAHDEQRSAAIGGLNPKEQWSSGEVVLDGQPNVAEPLYVQNGRIYGGDSKKLHKLFLELDEAGAEFFDFRNRWAPSNDSPMNAESDLPRERG